MYNLIKNSLSLFGVTSFITLLSCRHPQPPTPIIPNKTEQIVLVIPTIEVVSPKLSTYCPDDMVYIDKTNSCIDLYEAPNKKGIKPYAARTAYQGVAYCKSVGKSLCTIDQWQIACEGPQKKLYPYGDVYNFHTCNDDKFGWVKVPWMLMGTSAWAQWAKTQYKGEPSGNRPACVSDYGVYDMTGNVAEWTIATKTQYGYATLGAYWYGALGGETARCKFVNQAHNPGFNSYEFGFRCCYNSK